MYAIQSLLLQHGMSNLESFLWTSQTINMPLLLQYESTFDTLLWMEYTKSLQCSEFLFHDGYVMFHFSLKLNAMHFCFDKFLKRVRKKTYCHRFNYINYYRSASANKNWVQTFIDKYICYLYSIKLTSEQVDIL